MIAKQKTQLAIGLILSFTYASGICSEPNQPAIELKFLSSASLLDVALENSPPIKPTNAAVFTVQWRFEPTGEPNVADLLTTSAGKSFSARQRELLKTEQNLWLDSSISETYMSKNDMPFGSATYTAFAVSEQDAKKMGRAVLEFLIREEKETARRMKKDHLEKLTTMQSKLREDMAKAKEEIEAKEREVSSAKKEYEGAVRSSPYSLHPANEVPREVLKTISEMDKMLDLLNIEIVGIQSKLSAIKRYSNENETLGRGTLVMTLREMAIRQEIELISAESRQQATMTIKKREEVLYNLFETLCGIEQEVRNLEDKVKQITNRIRYLDQDIDHVGPGELTFYIDGGRGGKKVAIQRVRVKVGAKESFPLYRN